MLTFILSYLQIFAYFLPLPRLEIGEKLNEVHCDVLNSTNARCDEQKIEKITFEGSPSLRFEFQHPSDNSKSFLQVFLIFA